MGILTRNKIIDRLNRGELIADPRKKEDGSYDVEAASYDLAAGIAVSKRDGTKIWERRVQQCKFIPGRLKQETATLKPGQMMFVITHEEVKMPEDLCGTVYSRNNLAQKGILALNAGHIDPGFHGPITIRLINLRSTDYTLKLGDPIFTIVFHTLDRDPKETSINYRKISKEETLDRVLAATDIALNNALYDLALLREFVKENEFGRALRKWLFKTFWGLVTLFVTGTLFILGAIVTISKVYDLLLAKGIIK